MKAGTENRNKTVIAGALIALLLVCVVYAFTQLTGGSPTPAPGIAPIAARGNAGQPAADAAGTTVAQADRGNRNALMPSGVAAGVNAKKLASTSGGLDPTLDQAAMLRTERLVYSGNGRNIFSASYTPPVAIPKPLAPARKSRPGPQLPPPPPPPPPTCPPSCPPIPLKFFGTATRSNGARQAFLLQGEDVFLASPGDIVARRYKVVAINPSSIQIEDLGNNNTQTLPLQN